MIELCITGISTLIEPSATAHATAAFARLLDHAALGTDIAATYNR